jgi:hypothetical protein
MIDSLDSKDVCSLDTPVTLSTGQSTITLKNAGTVSQEIPIAWLAPFEYFQALVDTQDTVITLPIGDEHLTDILAWIKIQKGRDIPKPPKPVSKQNMTKLEEKYPALLRFVRELFEQKRQVYFVELIKEVSKYTVLSFEGFLFTILGEQIKEQPMEYIQNFFKTNRKVRDE